MKITALVENKSEGRTIPKHGLSLYIETQKHKILFDLGPDDTLFKNAEIMNIDLSEVDTVVISHGHMDHGGALKRFLQVNGKARIYVQRTAFEPHYSKFLFLKVNVGLDAELKSNPQIVLTEGDYQIDEELSLFTVSRRDKCYSGANDALYNKSGKDDFLHEQNLLIRDKKTVLITGCGHTGIVNIMEKAAAFSPQVCIGGFHLFNPLTKKTEPLSLLNNIAQELQKYDGIRFYTCHCTGSEAYQFLVRQLPDVGYLSCGKSIDI